MKYRIGASVILVLVLAALWLAFGDTGSGRPPPAVRATGSYSRDNEE